MATPRGAANFRSRRFASEPEGQSGRNRAWRTDLHERRRAVGGDHAAVVASDRLVEAAAEATDIGLVEQVVDVELEIAPVQPVILEAEARVEIDQPVSR